MINSKMLIIKRLRKFLKLNKIFPFPLIKVFPPTMTLKKNKKDLNIVLCSMNSTSPKINQLFWWIYAIKLEKLSENSEQNPFARETIFQEKENLKNIWKDKKRKSRSIWKRQETRKIILFIGRLNLTRNLTPEMMTFNQNSNRSTQSQTNSWTDSRSADQ